MTREEVIAQLCPVDAREYKMLQRIFAGGYSHANRIYAGKVCNFNPMTGEEAPMNDDCRKSDEALDMAIKIFKSRDNKAESEDKE